MKCDTVNIFCYMKISLADFDINIRSLNLFLDYRRKQMSYTRLHRSGPRDWTLLAPQKVSDTSPSSST